MISSRLHQQGFINLHRKNLVRALAAPLAIYLFYAPDFLKVPDAGIIAAQIAGALMLFAGIMGRVLATITIGGHKDRAIIRTEAYSICRNPLYFASFLMALGIGLLSGRPDFMLLLASAYIAIFYPMMLNEAKFLRTKFGDFAEYEKNVPLFIPNFRLWEQRKTFEINFKLVKRTLLDASLALPVIPLMIIIQAIRRAGLIGSW